MKKMKIRIVTTILIAGALSLSSCQKKVLDLVPFTAQSDESAFANPDAVQLSVYGVYDACQSGFYAGGAVRGYPFGALDRRIAYLKL